MDRAAESPWTRRGLGQIRRCPGVVSTELAADAGQERAAYKLRVRRAEGTRTDRIAGDGLPAVAARRGVPASAGLNAEVFLHRFTNLLEWLLFAGFLHGRREKLGVACRRPTPATRCVRSGADKGIPDATVARLPGLSAGPAPTGRSAAPDREQPARWPRRPGSPPRSCAKTCPTSAPMERGAWRAMTCSISFPGDRPRGWDRPTTGR